MPTMAYSYRHPISTMNPLKRIIEYCSCHVKEKPDFKPVAEFASWLGGRGKMKGGRVISRHDVDGAVAFSMGSWLSYVGPVSTGCRV